jgi:hypothetical protein
MLPLSSCTEVQATVREFKAERHARGFTCYGQFEA